MSFAPCSFPRLEPRARANDREREIASQSPYYDRVAYPERVLLCTNALTQYTYWLFPTAEDAAIHVANSIVDSRQWFFCIEQQRTAFFYMDFDRDPGMGVAEFLLLVRRGAALFCCFVDALYGFTPASRPIEMAQWWFYQACTATKLSAHAHSRIAFANVEVMREVMARFRAWMDWRCEQGDTDMERFYFAKRSKGKPTKRTCMIDFAVYTKRPFRLPLNRKNTNTYNYLQPVEPDASVGQVEEILRGFIHPHENEDALNPLPHPDELVRIRSAWPSPATVNHLDALSCAISALVLTAYQLPQGRPFCQAVDNPWRMRAALAALTPPQRTMLLSTIGHIVERVALLDTVDFLDFHMRGSILQVAWEHCEPAPGDGLVACARESNIVVSPIAACPLHDILLQRAYVALELRRRVLFQHEQPLGDFLEARAEWSLEATGMEEFRLAAPTFLCIPFAHIPLACFELARASPFSRVGPALLPPPDGGGYQ